MPKARTIFVLAILVFASVGVSQTLRATPLAPGSPLLPPDVFTAVGLSPLATASSSFGYVDPTNEVYYSGEFVEGVYTDSATGNLDFLFQFNNVSIGEYNYLTSLTDSSFAGYSTDAGYITDLTGIGGLPVFTNSTATPDYVGRSNVPGSDINWIFTQAGSNIGPGIDTSVVAIKTNATNYDNKGAAILGFYTPGVGTASISFHSPLGIFEPTPISNSVPEPSTFVLLGVGLFGLALAASLKRKGVCSSSISA